MLTTLDLLRLTKLLLNHPYAVKIKTLEEKLKSFKVVESIQAPEDLVTMNSVVVLHDMTRNETMKIKLVYQLTPLQGNQTSILSPLGANLLGMKKFETCEYATRDGQTREFRVLDIIYQPEKEGQFDL